jgi:hypothetical protein
VLDSAGYGPVTLAKSVALTAPPGVYAGVTVTTDATSGVIVNGAGIEVTLRGLTINENAIGYAGIWVVDGARLTVERVAVRGFNLGFFSMAPGSQTFIHDSTFSGSRGSGISVGVNTGADIRATLDRVRVEANNGYGVAAQGGATVQIRDSVLAVNASSGLRSNSSVGGLTTRVVADAVDLYDNGSRGALADSNGAGNAAELVISRSTISHNATSGVSVQPSSGGSASAIVSGCTITSNGTNGVYNGGGTVHVAGNTVVGHSFGYRNQSGTFNTLKDSYVYGNTTNTSGVITQRTAE